MSNHTHRKPKAPFILIPLYIYPLRKGETWAPLFEAVRRYPYLSFVVIVNPDSGPGKGPLPDENYLSALRTLVGLRNVTILGYVAVCWAERGFDEVARDVRVYYHWEKSTHKCHSKIHDNAIPALRIDGIFFDEAPSKETEEAVRYMSNASKLARSLARSADRPWNNTQTSRAERYLDMTDLTSDIVSPGHLPSRPEDGQGHDADQAHALSPPCTIIYNPGTPPSHRSPFFDCSTQADYIVIFEQTLATWPTPRPEPSNHSLAGQSLLSNDWQGTRSSGSSSGSSSSSSSLCFSPWRSFSSLTLAPDLDEKTDPNPIDAPDMEETHLCESEHKKGREYIASCLASLSPEERAKSIAMAHSVASLQDQLRFAAGAVEYGLAGHFATSSGDYSSWSGASSREEPQDCLGAEDNMSVSLSGGSLVEERGVNGNITVDSSSHWMRYVKEADRLASHRP